ncbi:hypothetical protein ZONE111904_09480 [Zobellia nedashkovskayae]
MYVYTIVSSKLKKMNIRIIYSIFLFTLSTSLFSQNSGIILGSWIKTEMEAFDKKSDPFIEKRDEKFIKYTFENNGQMYISSVYNEKGNEIKYTIKNDIIDLLFNKFKIEKIDARELVLIELNNNKISPSSTRMFFTREQVYLDGLALNEKDIIKEGKDYLHIENQKVYPKFRNKDFADVKSFIQPFVEERSNGKEHLSYSTFVINTDGKVSDIKIHHHINKSYDKNLKKAISKTNGMWISPIVNGKKVKVLKEVLFHYIVFPDLKNVNGKIEVNQKTSDITKSYESLFKKGNKGISYGEFRICIENIF